MKIVLHGTPISKMRPRLGKNVVYDPQTKLKLVVKKWMQMKVDEAIKENAKEVSKFLSADAFDVSFTFYFKPKNNQSKARIKAKLSNLEPCLVRNDLDNMEKFYCDCANGVLFGDDHQIVKMSSTKLWSEDERVEIIIEPYQVKHV